MNPVQLQTLITRVRQRANMEGATSFVTDAEITDNLNVSLAGELHDLIRLSGAASGYYRKPYTFTTTSAQSYDLPANLLTLISVDISLSSTQVLSCRMAQEEERNVFKFAPVGWGFTSGPILYLLQGNQIAFAPVPTPGFSVTLNMQTVSPQLVLPTDNYDDINGWSEIAVLDAASKCLIKEGQIDMAQYLDLRKERMKARIQALAPLRVSGEPERVHMHAETNNGFGPDGWGY